MDTLVSNFYMCDNSPRPCLPTRCILLVESALPNSVSMLDKLARLDDCQAERINDLALMPTVVEASSPDVLILSVDTLEDVDLSPLVWLKENMPLPVIIFTRKHSATAVKSVVAAGVSTYIVDDVLPERLPVILDLAIERFAHMQSLNTELEQTKRRLSERKAIERAKGIVMRKKNCSEDQAYREIRKSAMDQGKPMVELATRIISVFDQISD